VRRFRALWSLLITRTFLLFAVVGALAVLSLVHRSQSPSAMYLDARSASGLQGGPPLTAYPWADAPESAPGDPWGFPKRQCTSYAAWYLNSHGIPFATRTRGPDGIGEFASATTWPNAADKAGFEVSAIPLLGSIAHWYAGESSHSAGPTPAHAGGGGHVGVVIAVMRDHSVLVAEYDGQTRRFGTRHDRAPRYIYIGLKS
jgi:surface antigen